MSEEGVESGVEWYEKAKYVEAVFYPETHMIRLNLAPHSGPSPVEALCRKKERGLRTLFRFSIASNSFFVDRLESGPHLFLLNI